MYMRYALFVLGLSCVIGCHHGPVTSSSKAQQNVLVVDDGIDPSVEALRDRVAGQYSIMCTPTPADNTPPPSTFDEAKSRALDSLRMRDERCHVIAGIAAKSDPLADIAKYRDRWNQMVQNSQFGDVQFTLAEFDEITSALQNELPDAHYHGTATSSVIAYDNPDVRLVLVEEPLGNATSIMQNFNCIQQQDIDRSVALWNDPDVHQAIIDRPTSTVDEEMNGVILQHHVGVANESFGPVTRQTLEMLQAMKGCATVDLKPYFALQSELMHERGQAHPLAATLTVKSAGNDHSEIDAPADSVLCGSAAAPRLLMGAYDLSQQLAQFTNFGGCVDAFAPGVNVIGTLPAGWLMPVNGTSFSAPLVARLVSLDGAMFTTDGARDRVLGEIDDQRRVPMARFPRSIFYDPDGVLGPHSFSAKSAVVEGATPPLRISERQLRDLLALLRLGR
jgi:subtilase family protein